MKTYWVLWTYIGNYSSSPIVVQAASPEDAVEAAVGFYSPEFVEKGRVFVFDSAPSFVRQPTNQKYM